MGNIKNELCKYTTPIGISETTDMSIYQSYTANSGMKYMVGVREMNDLLIVEQIAEGVACTFLCGVLIYNNKTNQLIQEIKVDRNVHYSREKVMNLVLNSLINTLNESSKINQMNIDIESATNFLLNALDKCYFEKSRHSIIEWAKSVGIL
jgi:hypothetical protein